MLLAHYGPDALAVAEKNAAGSDDRDATALSVAWAKVIPLLKDGAVTGVASPGGNLH